MLTLDSRDTAMLQGAFGAGPALAMRIVAATARVMNASALIDVTCAHIDGCLYHGAASLDFVERFVASGAKIAVPTTLNVGSLDLIHPELYRGDSATANAAKRLMNAHLELGCEASFTCAPYQLKRRPRLGDQIAWAESNAIVFANSVLGARTSRYGDFLDLAAAITGRVPHAGLHVTENRAARVVIEAPDLNASSHRDADFATLGFLLGGEAGATVAAITGLPGDTSEDELKALGAAAASSGSVALFHAVGITPEAPTLDAALQGRRPERTVRVSAADLAAIRRRWNQARPGAPLAAVSLGTPHFSVDEFRALSSLFDRYKGAMRCDFYVNTSRYVLWQLEDDGMAERLAARGVQIVVDTCTYITPVMKQITGLVMTNSGKWAHYAPANIGVTVAFGSMNECVRSAFEGKVCIDEAN
ncbi:aconitase X catalytic domain-containing protein [Caballeronia sp. TF1N1]|uniref:aconitase X n=1 Tax=Caballeronia sp. TF1N1 TaxID=2878153 RepID=UPI001FD2E8F2|nr:aconitase X catalytic domain-containing protein [Caballeronia sp. TF1N1]